MSYAMFAQRKLVLDSQLTTHQMMQAQRSDEQFALATQEANLQQQLSSMQAAQTGELKSQYDELTQAGDSDSRAAINAEIQAMEAGFDQELQNINNEIYEVAQKENRIELEVKRLDTMVTKEQQELQAVEQAEAQGIQNAQAKYAGIN